MNPYEAPKIAMPRSPTMSWRAALMGGAVAIGAGSVSGTMTANASVWLDMQRGLTMAQAYANVSTSLLSPSALVGSLFGIASGYWGGQVAAKYGRGHYLMESGAAGFITVAFSLLMMYGPLGQGSPLSHVAIGVLIPLLSSLWGGWAYARRA